MTIEIYNISDSEEEPEPYILVERTLKKRFNARKSQREYCIKWRGYSAKENTWELPTNIPDDVMWIQTRTSAAELELK